MPRKYIHMVCKTVLVFAINNKSAVQLKLSPVQYMLFIICYDDIEMVVAAVGRYFIIMFATY